MSDPRKEDDAERPLLRSGHSTFPKLSMSNEYYGETESHQYEQDESEVWWHHQLQRHFEDKGHWWTFARKSDFLRWTLTLVTGFFCGAVALFVTYSTKFLTQLKLQTFYAILEKEKSGEYTFGVGYTFLFGCNLILGFLAWLTVYFEPLAAGSGMMTYLIIAVL